MRYALQIAMALLASLAAAADRPTVGLLTDFSSDIAPAVRMEFRLETERAMSVAGVELAWRTLGSSGPEESFDRLVVLRFRGECKPLHTTTSRRSLPLGLTHMTDGHVLPFVEIDCQRIQEAMEAGGWQMRALQPAVALGRALGRVAAHEIHHVLVANTVHDDDGLMKRSFDWRDLCGPELAFSPESVRRLKTSLGITTAQMSARAKTTTDD